jgi:hypothetical protein
MDVRDVRFYALWEVSKLHGKRDREGFYSCAACEFLCYLFDSEEVIIG